MENQYGIVVSNKYALFLNENDDPLDIIRQQAEAKVKKKDTVKKEVDKTKTAKLKSSNKKIVAPSQQEPKSKTPEQSSQRRDDSFPSTAVENTRREGAPPRGQGRGRGRGNFRPVREPESRDSNEFGENETDRRPPRRREEFSSSEFRERSEGFGRSGGFGRSDSGFGKTEGTGGGGGGSTGGGGGFGGRSEGLGFNRNSEEGSFGRSEGFRGRGPRRGGRGGRGGRGAPGGPGFGDRGGKREFERHSGSDKTGVKAVDKREGGGSSNWGTVKDDMEEQMKETENPDWSTQVEDAENQDPNETAVEPSGEANPEVPEEEAIVKQMTLDEWKAMERKNRFKADFNIRKPNEGVDETQWKKTYVLKKNQESENEDEEEEEDEGYEDEPRRGKNILHNIKITFNDSPRRGGGRGRRGRGGGGEGRGGGSAGEGRGGNEGGSGGRGGREGEGGRGGRGGSRTVSQRADKKGPRESAPCMDDETDFPRLVHTAA